MKFRLSLLWMRCLLLAALGVTSTASAVQPSRPPSQDLFSICKHMDFTEEALEQRGLEELEPSAAALDLLRAVQRRTDFPLKFADLEEGEKHYGNFYLHYVWPDYRYVPEAEASVLAELGKPGGRPTLEDFVEVSRLRFETQLAHLLSVRGSDLQSIEVGMVIYAIGIRVHTVQDFKHRMNNRGHQKDILSREHFFPYSVQMGSDVVPATWRRVRAVHDTADFFASLRGRLGSDAWKLLVTAINTYDPKPAPEPCQLVPAIPAGSTSAPPLTSRWCTNAGQPFGIVPTPSFTMEWMFPSWDWTGRDGEICRAYDPTMDRKVCKASIL